MSTPSLTKDADALICAIYKTYLQRRKSGNSKEQAKALGEAAKIQAEVVPKWPLPDVEDTLWELHRAGLLSCFGADNTVYDAILSDAGIIYMENRFKNGLKEVLDYLEQIKSILLW
mgnify:CR=1 FL=1